MGAEAQPGVTGVQDSLPGATMAAGEGVAADGPEPRLAVNLAALRDWAPGLQAQLAGMSQVHSELLAEPDGELDIAFLGQRFYRADARAHAEAQVARFFEAPTRNLLNEPDPESLKGGIGDFCRRVTTRMSEAGIAYEKTLRREESHFLVVLGVGLGLHLPELMARSQCRCLILIEPTLENLYHSLRVLDWAELLAEADKRDVEIVFITDRDPSDIAQKTLSAIRGNNPVLTDGLYLFEHYPSAILQQAAAQLKRELYSTIRGLGFFEDEEVMARNSVANLDRPKLRLIDQPQPSLETPLFIVGSGPSLEQELDFIEGAAERVAVMSIGTTLRILLERGIRPDFHIELENTPNCARSVEATAAEFDTAGITFVGALSVDRRMSDCFEDPVFFLREENTGTVLLGQPVTTLSPSGPTVANAGLSAAIRLGFREIYLFGVDMGTREHGRYHADGSVFSTGLLPENRRAHQRFAGNFGGEAWGEAVLNWSRLYLEAVLRMFSGVTVYNCSDGVRIEGAIPKVSRVIELPREVLDRPRLLAALKAGLAGFDRAELASICNAGFAKARDEAVLERLIDCLTAAEAGDLAELEWAHEIFRLLRAETAERSLIASFVKGSVIMILGCALWYDRRLSDRTQFAAFRRIALQEAIAALKDFRGRIERIFEDAEKVLKAPEARP
ncbi:MAG: DUF115 domain-containing protein [Kiloniellales bacterium]|nr:DUF115 domain-containing protein [Kiloniellales bacterium]